MAAAVDLVDDVDDAAGPVKQNRAAMPGRRVDPVAANMLGRPVGDITVIGDLRPLSVRMTV